MLFSDRSIFTMVHGIGFGGAALLGLAAALFYLYAARPSHGMPPLPAPHAARALALLTVVTAAMLWLTVIGGTYVVFPLYRATPPPGTVDLGQFPRALIHARPDTVWLHAFAMEAKEHMPWIAAILASAVAFVTVRYRSHAIADASLRGMSLALLTVSFTLVALASLLGVFVNKVAPLQ
jgi:hypothetical protein